VLVCKANLLSNRDVARATLGGGLETAVPAAAPARLFIVFHCEPRNNARMAEHVYKKIEIVGSSPNGMEEAVHNALSRASKTIRNMRWFEVTETRGYIDEGKIEHWQVTLKIGFTLEE
jgi:flavin-binding protein dodecin